MKLLVDMDLSPEWVGVLQRADWEAVHWSSLGNPRAADSEIMAWTKRNGSIVSTHDVDFGTLLALTQAEGPSVIQVRTQDVTPACDWRSGHHRAAAVPVGLGTRSLVRAR